LLDVATPYAFGISVLVLLFTLVVGTGAGTAASERSWITTGGLRLGQPAELAKLAVILMLARCARRRGRLEPRARPAGPCVIAGLPTLLVTSSPTWSAMVYHDDPVRDAVLGGHEAVAAGAAWLSGIGLAHRLLTVAWAPGSLCCCVLLWWRPYVWEGLAVMLRTGHGASRPVLAAPGAYQQNRLLALLNPQQDPGPQAGTSSVQDRIGSGGFLGRGSRRARRKRLAFLPAQFPRFHLFGWWGGAGFVGVLVALALLVALILILLRIARRATDP